MALFGMAPTIYSERLGLGSEGCGSRVFTRIGSVLAATLTVGDQKPMRVIAVVLALVASANLAEAQIAAAVVAPGNDGTLHLDANGNGVFAVVAVNLGKTPGFQLQGQWCGGFDITATGASTTALCVLDTASGACATAPVQTLSTQIEQGKVSSLGVLVLGGTPGSRIVVTFKQYADNGSGLPFHCAFPSQPHAIIAERGAVSIAVAN